jgi:hypothetical protein
MKDSEFSDAVMHHSVYERFCEPEVPLYDSWTPYRPQTLSNHVDFKDLYAEGATGRPPRSCCAANVESLSPIAAPAPGDHQ